MKLYVGHSRDFDYKNDLYEPLRKSLLNKSIEIILPHENSDLPFNSKEGLKDVDYMLAESSYPSTGLGIELGWADLYGKHIIAAHKAGVKLSNSVKSIATHIIEYQSTDDLLAKLQEIVLK